MPKILYHDDNFNPISPYCYLIYTVLYILNLTSDIIALITVFCHIVKNIVAYIYCVGSTIVLIHLSFTLFIQEPEKIVLGRYNKKIRKGSKLVDVEKEDKAYYVPILTSIQQLLTNDSVVEEVNISLSIC